MAIVLAVAVPVALDAPPALAAVPGTVAADSYTVAVPNGSFEAEVLPDKLGVQRPTGSLWMFGDTAGIIRTGNSWTKHVPTFPDGVNLAYIQNIGKFSVRTWVGPGDRLRFRAIQRLTCCGADHTVQIRVDGATVGSVTPSRSGWGTYEVPLGVARHGVVTLEFIGARLPGDRTAFIDAVSLVRPAIDIPDTGLPAAEQAGILSTRTDRLAAGVVGVLKSGDSEPLVDTPVQALAEWIDPATGRGVIFVGGKFSHVEIAATLERTPQSYLAAFDRDTGAWIPGFRPVLDGTVWDLDVTAGGALVVGGQFTSVNGVPYTAGVAALDPRTGAVVPGWRASLVLGGSTVRPFARAVKVSGDTVFIGGLFTAVQRSATEVVRAGNIERLSAADGRVDTRFTGSISSQVYDIDATSDRVYAVGHFNTVNGVPRASQAVLDAVTGASVPGMAPMGFTDDTRRYQQAVMIADDEVWVGGSQHSLQTLRRSDNTLLRSYVVDPWGDTQAIAESDGYVYTGNHTPAGSFVYTDATTWPALDGWTTRDPAKWIVAIDASTRTVVPMWQPQIGAANGEGAWELLIDSKRCMWAGGDFNRGSSTSTGTVYVRGFARFCPVDTTAPTRPTSLVVTTASGGVGTALRWGGSTDDRAGRVRYEVFRNDRPIASDLVELTFVDPTGTSADRYVVRALDVAGNA